MVKVGSALLLGVIVSATLSARADVNPLEVTVPKAYTNAAGKVLLYRAATPARVEAGKKYPLVVFIQGSAWTDPNAFWEVPQLSRLAQRGYVVATVTHRSCFEAKAPAFLVDVKSAIRFLKANAAEYDIDPGEFLTMGRATPFEGRHVFGRCVMTVLDGKIVYRDGRYV